jgi:hypothetical protein
MGIPEHQAILRQGAKAWNSWRTLNPGVRPDLFGTSTTDPHTGIIGPDLNGADYRQQHGASLSVAQRRVMHVPGPGFNTAIPGTKTGPSTRGTSAGWRHQRRARVAVRIPAQYQPQRHGVLQAPIGGKPVLIQNHFGDAVGGPAESRRFARMSAMANGKCRCLRYA